MEGFTAPDLSTVITAVAAIGGVLMTLKVSKKGWREVLSFMR